MIPAELKDKLLMLLEKVGLPTDLTDKIKSELDKGGEVEVTKVEVSSDKGITSEMIDKMESIDEVKSAFKKHLEMCGKEKPTESKSGKVLDTMQKGMY